MLLNFDKRGAEWIIVAYLSADENMLRIVTENKDAHSETGSLITGLPIEVIQRERKLIGELSEPNRIEELRRLHMPEMLDARFIPRTMSVRQCGKKSNHGLNYDEQFRTFALVNELEEKEAKRIIHLYRNVAYPGIPEWYREIQAELRDNDRVLTDLLGNKCFLMGNWNEDLFRQGYAYKPQSTVGRMVNRALSLAMDDEADFMQPMEILSQVHDNIVVQYPLDFENMARMCIRMDEHMSPQLTHKGRTFALQTDCKVGFNRAHMLDVTLSTDVGTLAASLEQAYSKLISRKAAA
jgi:DNA polymerase I-like protein with 3'-5' exonuclease and polymerase domains